MNFSEQDELEEFGLADERAATEYTSALRDSTQVSVESIGFFMATDKAKLDALPDPPKTLAWDQIEKLAEMH